MRVAHLGAKTVGVGAFLLLCSAVFVYLYLAAGGTARLKSPYSAKAIVPTAFQLVPQGDVRRSGVKIGKVTNVDYKGSNGVVEFEITEPGQAPLYRDARLLVRTKTLVGENYLEVDPGTPRAGKLPSGATLPLKNSDEAVQLDEILSTLDPPTRRRVSADLRASGLALGDRGRDINRLIGEARPVVSDTASLAELLDAQRGGVSRLIDNTGEVLLALSDRRESTRTLVTAAKTTAEAVAARDQALGQAIDELPSTLGQARTSTARLASFASTATPVIHDLRLATVDLTPVLRDLGPTAVDARRLFAEIPPFRRQADPLLAELSPFTRTARPTLRSLDALLRQANPALGYLSPYSREAGAFFANTGSANDSRDAVGNRARVFPIISETSFASVSPEQQRALQALRDAGLLGIEPGTGDRLDAYPEPGTVDRPRQTPPDFMYPRVRGDGSKR